MSLGGYPAERRWQVAWNLLHKYGFDVIPPAWPPNGFVHTDGVPTSGAWHLRGQFGEAYVDAEEQIDTRLSYPAPARGYAYLVHVITPSGVGRNVSFHMDLRQEPEGLLYHWHDYEDGSHTSNHHVMSPITLTWFLEVSLSLILDPRKSVPELFTLYPPSQATPDFW